MIITIVFSSVYLAYLFGGKKCLITAYGDIILKISKEKQKKKVTRCPKNIVKEMSKQKSAFLAKGQISPVSPAIPTILVNPPSPKSIPRLHINDNSDDHHNGRYRPPSPRSPSPRDRSSSPRGWRSISPRRRRSASPFEVSRGEHDGENVVKRI